MKAFWRASFLSIASVLVTGGSAWAADRITLSYGLLERSISIESLEVYAQQGKISEDLERYTRYLNDEQLRQLRQVLQTKAALSPVAVSQFLYTDQGEVLLNRLGEVIRTESNLSGFYAMRSALIQAAAQPDGLTVINTLEQFPISTIRLDLSRALRIFGDLETLIRQTQEAIALIEQQADLEAQAISPIEFAALPDLRLRGRFTWDKYTIQLRDRQRDRIFPADLYLPLTPDQQPLPNAPVIVISHGLGSDRDSFVYLAQQLASYGFAVAVPEHPGSNAEQLQALISGRASQVTEPAEFVDRPLDIKFLLNTLERRSRNDPRFVGRLDLQQVGVVGQSFGGYTALALAGAKINIQQLQSGCTRLNDTFNLSLLLQCRALELSQPIPDLKDDRVKAIIAINPIGSSLFGQTSFANIQVPAMIVSSGADTVAPALLEQLQPFTWLQTPDKYLMVLARGTHFSTIAPPAPEDQAVPIPSEVVGPDPVLAQTYLRAVGVAFFTTYVANEPGYRPYLTASYTRLLSQALLPVSLVRSLTAAQLAKVYRPPTEASLPIADPNNDPNSWSGQQP
ncbi:alpha/beta hydrolase [Phormidium tenue FACHB-886]|nr:alpha/beta hydrolase [Phormidium tenue FACHB-886]